MNYTKIVSTDLINKTVYALKARGFNATVAENAEEAKSIVLAKLPQGSKVMTMTSKTLDQTGISEAINAGSDYVSLKNQLYSMNRETEGREMQRLGAAPENVIGSVHAITEGGQVVIASATGSQLPAYAYGADHVIWVVGAQKIVPTMDEAMKRLNEYVLPLESERARKAYRVEGSNVSKLLIMNNEFTPNRIEVVIVKEELGF